MSLQVLLTVMFHMQYNPDSDAYIRYKQFTGLCYVLYMLEPKLLCTPTQRIDWEILDNLQRYVALNVHCLHYPFPVFYILQYPHQLLKKYSLYLSSILLL